MKYSLYQKISYPIIWLFCDQNWRRSVDERNRKAVSNWILWLSSCCWLFINNRIQSIAWDIWNINEFWLDSMLVAGLTIIWWIVWLIIKRYRTNIKLQVIIFMFSIMILFITLYSYLWQNKKKTAQWLKNLMRISEH
jgi:hypothetical protein